VFDRVDLNGTTYHHLTDLPPGFAVRIQPFKNLSIWRNLPKNSDLAVRSINVMPETWLTTCAQHLPAVPPSAVEAPRDAQATTSGRHAASALVELYVTHYNRTLSPAKAEALVRRSAENPDMVSDELSHLYPTHCQESVTREVTEEDSTGRTTASCAGNDGPDQAQDRHAKRQRRVDGPARMNPSLWNDGSFWLIDIPQVLHVEIRASKKASPVNADVGGWYAVEYRRVVRYTANESRDINIRAAESSVRSGWTDEVPAPPPAQRKAFQDAVIGKEPLYSPTRLLTKNDASLIIATFTIILVTLVALVIVVASL